MVAREQQRVETGRAGQRDTVSGWSTAALVGVLAAFSAPLGCSNNLGSIPLLHPNADAIGTKLLRPGAEGRSCRASVLGVALEPGLPDVQEAIAHLVALDAEGDAVVNAQVSEAWLATGVYNRRCIVVRGDLCRVVETLTLPGSHVHGVHAAP